MERYKTVNGTSYNINTPDAVIQILENSREKRKRIKIHYGDQDGKDWNEIYDTCGYIGRSTGVTKIPILIKTARSLGGGAVLDNKIIKITANKRILYQQHNYKPTEFKVIKKEGEDYPYILLADGEIFTRHKTERGAKMMKNKLS